jgi:hypothetical protein
MPQQSTEQPAVTGKPRGKAALKKTVLAKKAAATPPTAPSAAAAVPVTSVRKPSGKPSASAQAVEAKHVKGPSVEKTPGPEKAEKPAKHKVDKPAKLEKVRSRLVRDSFTMPESDFALVAVLKSRTLDLGRATKKSELLRAGLQALASLESKALVAALDALSPLKLGRPKKGDGV